MTETTPTTPTPTEGLTDERLLELAAAAIDGYDSIEPGEFEPGEGALAVYGSELLAYARAAIAADRAARVGLHCYLDDDGPCPSPCVFDDPSERVDDCIYAQRLQRDGKPKTACSYYRPNPAPTPTPEEIEAQFRAWWAESYPSAPAGPHAVVSHVAFALHMLSRGVQ